VVKINPITFCAGVKGDILIAARGNDPEGIGHIEIDGLPDFIQVDEFLTKAVDGFIMGEVETFDADRAFALESMAQAGIDGVPVTEKVLFFPTDTRQ